MQSSRNASLDALRVLSLLGIVTLHVAAGGFHDNRPLGFVLDELGRSAVPVFFILSAYFWKPQELAEPLRLIGRVARRVGIPFVCWVLITIGWNAVFKPNTALDLSPRGIALMFWAGEPAIHLWFLPALILGTAITSVAGRYMGWRATAVLALVLFALGTAMGAYIPAVLDHRVPFWMDRNGVFFAPIFLVAGVLLSRHRDRVASLPIPIIAAAVVLFAMGQVAEGYFIVPRYPMGHDYSISTLGYGIAVALLFMCLDLRGKVWPILGRATFTAYLTHILVLSALNRLNLDINSLLLIALTFSLSLAIGVAWQWARTATRRAAASPGVEVEQKGV